MARLKIRGMWSGLLENVAVDAWTVPRLREEVAVRANCTPDRINLIFAGKILNYDDADANANDVRNLASLGVQKNSKIYATAISLQERDAFRREEYFFTRLVKFRAAAIAISKKHSSVRPFNDFNFLEVDQSRLPVRIDSEMEYRALVMGQWLHLLGMSLIERELYDEALSTGEEAFSICDKVLIERIPEVPFLHIYIVWCYLMKRDARSLSDAGKHLKMARIGMERHYMKDFLSPRLLEALHLRLELLEGAVAYHNGQIEKSRKALLSAKVKLIQHQGPVDDAKELLMELCCTCTGDEATRALKMCNGDVGGAIDFLIEEGAKDKQKCNDDNQTRNEIREVKLYGLTPSNKVVDIEGFERIGFMFDMELAAEALRRNENDALEAWNDLTNPETVSNLQADIQSMKRERRKQVAIEKAVQMGFERSRVVAAFEAGGTSEEVIQRLKVLSEGPSDLNKAEEQNQKTKGELSADIEIEDYLFDLDFEITTKCEGVAIVEYLGLVELALRKLWEDVPSQHDEKEG